MGLPWVQGIRLDSGLQGVDLGFFFRVESSVRGVGEGTVKALEQQLVWCMVL